MDNKYWYAIERDDEDDDWGTGSYNLEEAREMLREYKTSWPEDWANGRIAVIEDSKDPICVDVLFE